MMSDYRADSALNLIAARAPDPVQVPPDLYRVISRAVVLARATGGAFDPTVAPLTLIWPLVKNSPFGTSWLPMMLRPDSSTMTSLSFSSPETSLTLMVSVVVERSPMPQVLNRLNKDSQNLFAEAFNKALGRQWDLDHGRDEPGSWKSGSDAVHAFLRKHKIDGSKVVLVDGSGLSRQDRITARAISDLLITMHKHPYAETFEASLPIGGVGAQT